MQKEMKSKRMLNVNGKLHQLQIFGNLRNERCVFAYWSSVDTSIAEQMLKAFSASRWAEQTQYWRNALLAKMHADVNNNANYWKVLGQCQCKTNNGSKPIRTLRTFHQMLLTPPCTSLS